MLSRGLRPWILIVLGVLVSAAGIATSRSLLAWSGKVEVGQAEDRPRQLDLTQRPRQLYFGQLGPRQFYLRELRQLRPRQFNLGKSNLRYLGEL